MAKIKVESIIAEELHDVEEKVKEFQKYLRLNTIVSQVVKGEAFSIDELMLSEEQQDKLHKEIVIQIKMQDAVFNWLPLLQKLRESEGGKPLETRGNQEVNLLFKNRNNQKNKDAE